MKLIHICCLLFASLLLNAQKPPLWDGAIVRVEQKVYFLWTLDKIVNGAYRLYEEVIFFQGEYYRIFGNAYTINIDRDDCYSNRFDSMSFPRSLDPEKGIRTFADIIRPITNDEPYPAVVTPPVDIYESENGDKIILVIPMVCNFIAVQDGPCTSLSFYLMLRKVCDPTLFEQSIKKYMLMLNLIHDWAAEVPAELIPEGYKKQKVKEFLLHYCE